MDVGFLFLYSNGKKLPFKKFFVKVQFAIESFCENLKVMMWMRNLFLQQLWTLMPFSKWSMVLP